MRQICGSNVIRWRGECNGVDQIHREDRSVSLTAGERAGVRAGIISDCH